jgi:hypothetical protein
LLAPANGHADAIGARVIARVGSTMQLREVRSGSGYLSQNELKMIFGLGDSTAVDRLEIAWPSGRKQVLEHVPANQTLTVREPRDGTAGK